MSCRVTLLLVENLDLSGSGVPGRARHPVVPGYPVTAARPIVRGKLIPHLVRGNRQLNSNLVPPSHRRARTRRSPRRRSARGDTSSNDERSPCRRAALPRVDSISQACVGGAATTVLLQTRGTEANSLGSLQESMVWFQLALPVGLRFRRRHGGSRHLVDGWPSHCWQHGARRVAQGSSVRWQAW
jgi:hypothetical protein